MSAVITSPTVAAQWAAKVPPVGGSWTGFDACEWFASYAEASARDRAEAVFLGFETFLADEGQDVEDLCEHIEAERLALMESWGHLFAVTMAIPIEPWVSEVLDRIGAAYHGRLGELLLTSREGSTQ